MSSFWYMNISKGLSITTAPNGFAVNSSWSTLDVTPSVGSRLGFTHFRLNLSLPRMFNFTFPLGQPHQKYYITQLYGGLGFS